MIIERGWDYKVKVNKWNFTGNQILEQGDIVRIMDFDCLYVAFFCKSKDMELICTKKEFKVYMEVIRCSNII